MVRSLVQDGLTQRREVQEELRRRLPATDVPGIRTTANYIGRALQADRSQPWSLAAASGEIAALVLPALAQAIDRTGGRVRHLTRAEAMWVARLRRADHELAPWDALKLARRYIRTSSQAGLAELDRYVALRLWRGGEELSRALLLGVVSSRSLDPLGSEVGKPLLAELDAGADSLAQVES